jgi:hypothetical protein
LIAALAWRAVPSEACSPGIHGMQIKVPRETKNLIALSGRDPKRVTKGMKALSHGLGVECASCHVKGDFANDEKAAKIDARRFIVVALNERDPNKRREALAPLLALLGRERAEDEKEIWNALEMWSARN